MHITTQSILSAVCFLGVILAENLPDFPDTTTSALQQTPAITPSGQDASSMLPKVKRPKHTQCYNYFLDKDGCVSAAAKTSERCPVEGCGQEVPKDMPQVFKAHQSTTASESKLAGVSLNNEGLNVSLLKTTHSDSESTNSLVRRYDTQDSFPVAGGKGICGSYDTDKQPGVCLWAPSMPTASISGGWLNSTFTKTCGRQVYIQRQGNPNMTIYAPVIDGCTFTTNATDPGCFRIAFTQKTFADLMPNTSEASSQIIDDLLWGFDNDYGNKRKNAAP